MNVRLQKTRNQSGQQSISFVDHLSLWRSRTGSKRIRIPSIDKILYGLHFWSTKGRKMPLLVSMFHDTYRHCHKRRTSDSARQGYRSIQIACRCQRRCNDLAQKALKDLLARNRVANPCIALTKCELLLWLDSLFSHLLHFFRKDDLRFRC